MSPCAYGTDEWDQMTQPHSDYSALHALSH